MTTSVSFFLSFGFSAHIKDSSLDTLWTGFFHVEARVM